MNKTVRTLLAAGLVLAVATPALAEFKLNGYYRLMGYAGEVRSGGSVAETGNAGATTSQPGYDTTIATNDKGDSRQMIDQRLRMQLTYSLNDNVAIVYHGEVDTVWGEAGKAANNAGKLGADGINIETKNVYLDLKSGNGAARLGVQTLADAYQGVVFFDDMAAASGSYKMGATTLSGFYAKWDEDSHRSSWDDRDFWAVDVKHKFTDNFTAGASVYFEQDNDASVTTVGSIFNVLDDSVTQETFFYGLNADAKFGAFGLSGFVVLADGEVDFNGTGTDRDAKGMAASVKGTMKVDNGDLGLRLIYFSEDDDVNDLAQWRTPTGRYDFVNENLMQFLTDKFVLNYGKERYAMADAAEAGYGLLGLVASGNHKLPMEMYLNWGAGYFQSIEDKRNGETVASRGGETLGWEVAARLGKKYFEKVDVSLNASYADYGDFYDNTAPTGTFAPANSDPDATYKAYLMVNVPF